MIALFTDFGLAGPYTGQMKAVLLREAPGVPVLDLCADLPPFEVQGAAYLLAAYVQAVPEDAVLVGVVDPGVGGERQAVVVEADGRRYVGPDNGLFAMVARRATRCTAWAITWSPKRLSASFHGRDLFAPVAARLARGEEPPGDPLPAAAIDRTDWPDELMRVVYIDRYGNAVTGCRAAAIAEDARLAVSGTELTRAETFSSVPDGAAFWYENANGLAEIAVNQGRADAELGLSVGDPVSVRD